MAQRPSFDMTKMSTADKILVVGSGLLFIDSFLNWQKVCGPKILGLNSICGSANAWSGNGGFAGVLMALLALVLLAAEIAIIAGVAMPPTVPMPTVMAALTGGTVVFGILKFIFALSNHAAYGAYVGLVLILVVAYGGYMKMQETTAAPPLPGTGTGSGFTP
jgi:hypothetical protein